MAHDSSPPPSDVRVGAAQAASLPSTWPPNDPTPDANPAFWRMLVENAVEAVAVLTADGRIAYENPALVGIMGSPVTERLGRSAFDNVDPADRDRVEALFASIVNAPGQVVAVELTVRRADGTPRYVRASARNLLHDPTVRGIVASLVDITELRQREIDLARSEARFRDLLEAAPDSIVTIDSTGRVQFANTRCVTQFGFQHGEFERLLFRDLVSPEFHDLLELHLQSSARDPSMPPVSVHDGVAARRADGTAFPTELRLSRFDAGDGVHFVCIFRDLTLRKQSEREIRRLSTYPQQNPSPVLEVDSSGHLLFANPAAVQLADDLHVSTADLLAPSHANIIERCTVEPKRIQRVETQVGDRVIEWTYRHVDSADIIRLYGTDVTDKRKAEQRIEYDTLHDSVTGLANRTLFKARVDEALAACRTHGGCGFAVVLLDLDRFKIINESLGHVAGNLMLVEVSRRLDALLPQGACLARFGGDEFGVLLHTHGDHAVATRFAEEVQRKLSEPFTVAGEEVYTSASMGIAFGSPSYPEADYVLGDAERAMYAAKARGKARHAIADVNAEPDVKHLLTLETRMRKGLDRHEFVVLYQPIVSLESGTIAGFESLVRWRMPDGSLIEPARFVPSAEDTGLIVGIGHAVLEQTCRQVASWTARGLRPGLASVNISTRQFQREHLVEHVRETIQRHGVAPTCLKLEITETTAATDLSTVRETLRALKALGVGIVIDDFGTGYSSLSHLQHFPIDLLKIDRSFVSTVTTHSNSAAIIRAIVAMAHSLGLEVVAEGVETPDQLDFLYRQRVDYIQGFLFSPPVPPEQFEQMLISPRHLEYRPIPARRRHG